MRYVSPILTIEPIYVEQGFVLSSEAEFDISIGDWVEEDLDIQEYLE